MKTSNNSASNGHIPHQAPVVSENEKRLADYLISPEQAERLQQEQPHSWAMASKATQKIDENDPVIKDFRARIKEIDEGKAFTPSR